MSPAILVPVHSPQRRRSRWIGRWIAVAGLIHAAFGLVVFRSTYREILGDGLFHTVNGQLDRELAFWFLFFGLLAIVLGLLVDSCEARQMDLPSFFGWSLLGLTVFCLIVMPISGGWLLLPPAVGAIRGGR